MSQTAKYRLELIALVFAVIAGGWGMIGGLVLLPQRMDAMESNQSRIEGKVTEADKKAKADHDTLIRIEERIIAIQRDIQRGHK
jgi:hypothetical protein